MSDNSLMNPDHLKREVHDLETKLVPENEKLSNDLHEDYLRVTGYFENTRRGENTTLTADQVNDLIQTLAKFDMNRWRYSNSHKFALRVYKRLTKDRRWIIASKLKFLKK